MVLLSFGSHFGTPKCLGIVIFSDLSTKVALGVAGAGRVSTAGEDRRQCFPGCFHNELKCEPNETFDLDL